MPRYRLALIGLLATAAAAPAVPRPWQIYIGTQGSGAGQGIVTATFDPATGALGAPALAAEVERPTWVMADAAHRRLFAVSEVGNAGGAQAEVLSLQADRGGKLRTIERVPSGGSGATHLDYAPKLRTLFVANYGGGQVAAVPVAANGALAAPRSVQVNFGSGPHRRQKSPHAHGAVVDPSGRFVLSPDLGADRLFVYRYDGKALSPAATPFEALPPGSGPRHLVFAPDDRTAYLVTELTAEIYSYRWDAVAGRLTPIGKVSLDAADFTGTRSAAEIAISADGRFVYASNRAANAIQVFAADRGVLTPVQSIPCGGQVPWSFSIVPGGRWMVVANQGSGNLAVFAIDPRTGSLTATANSLSVAKPTSVTFLRN